MRASDIQREIDRMTTRIVTDSNGRKHITTEPLLYPPQHTPGPWRVIIDDTGGSFTGWPSVSASESLDCSIVHRAGFKQEYWGDLSQREAIANARLIAAAPDLLEALIEANKELEYLNDPKGFVSIRQEKIMEKARAAIAKAVIESAHGIKEKNV